MQRVALPGLAAAAGAGGLGFQDSHVPRPEPLGGQLRILGSNCPAGHCPVQNPRSKYKDQWDAHTDPRRRYVGQDEVGESRDAEANGQQHRHHQRPGHRCAFGATHHGLNEADLEGAAGVKFQVQASGAQLAAVGALSAGRWR